MTLPRTGAGPSKALSYLLRATFDAANQDFADGQVLDTVAEGVQVSSLTVKEAAGTAEILSNRLKLTATTTAYDTLGVYATSGISRVLGRALLGSIEFNTTAARASMAWSISNAGPPSETSMEPGLGARGAALLYAMNRADPGQVVATFASSVEYQVALVLGGYDASQVPWYSGAAGAHIHGSAIYIKGGAYTNWTLLWRSLTRDTATLYPAIINISAPRISTHGDLRVPDRDLKAVLQPTSLSTFTASNGTSLHAITPELGNHWVEQSGNWDIQGNQANTASSNAYAAVETSESDLLVDCLVAVRANSTNDGYGLFIRSTDAANGWKITISDFDNVLEMIERDTGSDTLRASTGIAIALNTDYHVRAIADGQTIDAFVDAGDKITYASASFNQTATKHGIYTRGGTYGRLDNFACFPRTSALFDAKLDAC